METQILDHDQHDLEVMDDEREKALTDDDRLRMAEDKVRASLTFDDIQESLYLLGTPEREALLTAYRKDNAIDDIAYYHSKAMDLYVRYLAEQKMEKA